MRIALSWFVTIMLALSSLPVQAFEAGGMPALQIGPIGEGVAFMELGPATGEGMLRLITVSGDERRDDQSQRLEGQGAEVAAASGFAVNPNLDFVIRVSHMRLTIKGDGDAVIGSVKAHSDSTEIIAGPSLWFGDLMLGAHASVLHYGEQVIETGDAKVTNGTVSMPRLRLYTAARAGAITVMARALLYNDARTSSKGIGVDGEGVDKDIKRRSAAETSLDVRLALAKDLAFAGSFGYIGADRATDGIETDYFVFGAGGMYTAAAWLSLAGGVHYTQASYASDSEASVVRDNLGGLRLDIGSHYKLQDLTVNFDMGYTIPKLVAFEDADTGSAIKIERAVWDVALGMILSH